MKDGVRKGILLYLLIWFFVSCSSAGLGEKAKNNNANYNSIQLINEALAKGEIDGAEAVILKVYAIFDRDKLPEGYRSNLPVKDATLIVRDIKSHFDMYDEGTKRKISKYLFRNKKR